MWKPQAGVSDSQSALGPEQRCLLTHDGHTSPLTHSGHTQPITHNGHTAQLTQDGPTTPLTHTGHTGWMGDSADHPTERPGSLAWLGLVPLQAVISGWWSIYCAVSSWWSSGHLLSDCGLLEAWNQAQGCLLIVPLLSALHLHCDLVTYQLRNRPDYSVDVHTPFYEVLYWYWVLFPFVKFKAPNNNWWYQWDLCLK